MIASSDPNSYTLANFIEAKIFAIDEKPNSGNLFTNSSFKTFFIF